MSYNHPYADGYPGFWKEELSIQHPLASIEFVAWDGSLTLILSKNGAVVDNFKNAFPLSRDLKEYNSEIKNNAIPPEKLVVLQRAELLRQEAAHWKREEQKRQAVYDCYPDSNDTFFFIVGYTPGGAPYGVTWEEMGMEPWDGLNGDTE